MEQMDESSDMSDKTLRCGYADGLEHREAHPRDQGVDHPEQRWGPPRNSVNLRMNFRL